VVTPTSYIWFQYHLERIAGLFMKDQSLADIVRKPQLKFPEGSIGASPRGTFPVTALEDILFAVRKGSPGLQRDAGPARWAGDHPTHQAFHVPNSAEVGNAYRSERHGQSVSADRL
jgi:hypothetical protein